MITKNMTVDIFFNRFDWTIAEGKLLLFSYYTSSLLNLVQFFCKDLRK